MGERHDAKVSIERSGARMSEIAQELARRASPSWVKAQVRERAVKRSGEMKERVSGSPIALGSIGGAAGLLAGITGGVMAARRHGRSIREPRTYHAGPEYGGYSEVENPVAETGIYTSTQGDVSVEGVGLEAGGYGTDYTAQGFVGGEYEAGAESGGIGAKGAELKERVGEKAGEVKWKAQEKFGHARERASEGAWHMRERASHMRERIPSRYEMKTKAQDNPSILAAVGLAFGALAGLLLPVTSREEQLLSGAKSKASRQVQKLGDKVQHRMDEVHEKISGSEEGHLADTSEFEASGVTGESFATEGTPSFYSGSDLEPPTDTRH